MMSFNGGVEIIRRYENILTALTQDINSMWMWHGCPVARARGPCLIRKTIKLSISKLSMSKTT